MAQKSISQGTLKTGFGVSNRPILALKVSNEAYWMGLRYFVRVILTTRTTTRIATTGSFLRPLPQY